MVVYSLFDGLGVVSVLSDFVVDTGLIAIDGFRQLYWRNFEPLMYGVSVSVTIFGFGGRLFNQNFQRQSVRWIQSGDLIK